MTRENIPQSMQIAYNCDYMEWDSTRCCFLCVASEPAGSWVTGEISYDEFMCAITDAEEYEWAAYNEYLAELEEQYYDTLLSLRSCY